MTSEALLILVVDMWNAKDRTNNRHLQLHKNYLELIFNLEKCKSNFLLLNKRYFIQILALYAMTISLKILWNDQLTLNKFMIRKKFKTKRSVVSKFQSSSTILRKMVSQDLLTLKNMFQISSL